MLHSAFSAPKPGQLGGERATSDLQGQPAIAHGAAGSAKLDGAAVGVASLCLLHCLALPGLAALLPFLAATAEAEWLHRALVLSAFPISAWAVITRIRRPFGILFAIGSLAGVAVLTSAIAFEKFEAFEVQLTVLGGLILFAAHGLWWLLHSRAPSA